MTGRLDRHYASEFRDLVTQGEPGYSIRISGFNRNHRPELPDTPFDLVFKIGHEAIYDRFNLIYTGRIVAIGPSTVTIEEPSHSPSRGTRHRLSLFRFAFLNWKFDAAKVDAYNAEELRCL